MAWLSPVTEDMLKEAEKSLLDLVWADDITIDIDETGLVDGLLSSTAMSVIYGESGSGKTFNAIDIACHVAAKMLWRGMNVDQGIVVYIAAESPKSIKRRVWAWKTYHGVAHLPLVVVQSHIDLLDPKATLPLLLQEIERIEAKYGKVVLIVIDTLSRAMAGADENSAKDMTGFIGNCDKLRTGTDAHVMIVHHCGKDLARGARGHSSLRAATDTEIEVANNVANVTKQRDMETLGAYGFALEEVKLGVNKNGLKITTCVAVPADVVFEGDQVKKKRLGNNEQIVFDTLHQALRESGTPASGPEPKAGTTVVTHEELRVLVARKLPQQELKKKNEAFDRAVVSLVRDNMIRHLDGLLWIGLG